MALIDKPERARQLARAISSDLTLYHEKEIIDGIENDNVRFTDTALFATHQVLPASE